MHWKANTLMTRSCSKLFCQILIRSRMNSKVPEKHRVEKITNLLNEDTELLDVAENVVDPHQKIF